jgi:hypothetical protein
MCDNERVEQQAVYVYEGGIEEVIICPKERKLKDYTHPLCEKAIVKRPLHVSRKAKPDAPSKQERNRKGGSGEA